MRFGGFRLLPKWVNIADFDGMCVCLWRVWGFIEFAARMRRSERRTGLKCADLCVFFLCGLSLAQIDVHDQINTAHM